MAHQVTGAAETALVREAQLACCIWSYDGGVEVHQVAVIQIITLGRADSMRVMADTARRSVVADVFVMVKETFIIEDAVTAVAVIAQRITGGALRRVVSRLVISHQDGLKI